MSTKGVTCTSNAKTEAVFNQLLKDYEDVTADEILAPLIRTKKDAAVMFKSSVRRIMYGALMNEKKKWKQVKVIYEAVSEGDFLAVWSGWCEVARWILGGRRKEVKADARMLMNALQAITSSSWFETGYAAQKQAAQ